MTTKSFIKSLLLALCVISSACLSANAQTSAFTYQGKLTDGSVLANGQYDFALRLFDAANNGNQIGVDAFVDNLQVTGGIFTVTLDFGANAFSNGAARFLEISVRAGTSTGVFTTLAPRQQITSSPFAIQTLKASSADALSVNCVLCVTDSQIQTVDGNKVTGTVANAATATNISGIVPVTNGGTGSSAKNFVDLSTNQTNIGGNKTFNGVLSGNGAGLTNVPGTFRWLTVSGLAQVAQSNVGYLTTNDDEQVEIILPPTPTIGDVVRVSASGAGGWRISQNVGQSIILSNSSISNIGAGVNWTARESVRIWQSVASSSDGTKLAVAVQGGQIYTSINSGTTWTPRESNRLWRSIATSADGTKLVAVVEGGQIHTSIDSGVSWTARESNRSWESVASSADGTKLVAVAVNGQIYTSTDSGASWIPRDNNRQWNGVVSSADGNKLAAIVFAGNIFTSDNAGLTWRLRENGRFWRGIASSADGTKLVAGDEGGKIYTSTDSGVTWTPRENNRRWWAFASSADGSKLVALAINGRIYTSNDSGVTWTARESARTWQAASSSADGNRLIAVVQSGQIYTSIPSTSDGPAGFLTGSQYSSVELQYIGNGQFLPISYTGTISGF